MVLLQEGAKKKTKNWNKYEIGVCSSCCCAELKRMQGGSEDATSNVIPQVSRLLPFGQLGDED